MITPQETHVFAVGITSYAIGPKWRLRRAADQALEFAVWARAEGVQPQNVHLFLSTNDHARLAPAIKAAGLTARNATFTTIFDFVSAELTTLEGALLYMFWSGHGNISESDSRVLFFEDFAAGNQVGFDLNDFFATLKTTLFKRFETQLAFIDACANRFEELGFKASLGQQRLGKGYGTHRGIRQSLFLAADSGAQAKEGAFGEAVLQALKDQRQLAAVWPPDQDAVVAVVRPQLLAAQRPVQLAWTNRDGDQSVVQRAGDLPGSTFVTAAAMTRKVPVRTLRRLADIALQNNASLADAGLDGQQRRDALYAALCAATDHPAGMLPRTTPGLEMLRLIAATFEWNAEATLEQELGRLGPIAEFRVELDRLALMIQARAVLPRRARPHEVHDEYVKTVSRLSSEAARDDARTFDAMLDELYQVSAAAEPRRPVWELLLRLAARFPEDEAAILAFLLGQGVPDATMQDLRDELQREQRFVLSVCLEPAHTEEPAIMSVKAVLVVAGTSSVRQSFPDRPVKNWAGVESAVAEIVKKAREIVMNQYRRDEAALLVEFLLPWQFLSRAPERTKLKIGSLTPALGSVHSVVVRLRERIADRQEALNIEGWESIAKRIDRGQKSIVHWMDASRAAPTPDTCSGLVVLRFRPPDNDLLEIVSDGYPFMAWLRSDAEVDWAAFVERLEAWATPQPLSELARDVRSLRKKANDVGAEMTLFWDDPEQAGHWLRLQDVSTGAIDD